MHARRHLWLIRHAESPGQSGTGLDVDRHLSERGLADCASLAHWLTGADPSTWLVTSSAKRCVLTSQALAEALGVASNHQINEPRLYEASDTTMLDELQSIPADVERAAIIAHNPAVSAVASRLLGKGAGVHMPPGSCIGLFGPERWHDFQWGQCNVSASWSPGRQPLVAGSSAHSQASNLSESE